MSYYDFFDDQTNNGRVFDTDLSELDELPVKHLTAAEVTERKHWREAMQRIYDHYDDMDSPRVSTTELLLQQRVMVPNLGSMSVSSRSQFKEARRGRRYPPTISAWDGFKQRVEAFQPQHKELRPKYSDIFQLSMFDTSPKMMLCEEKDEEGYMLSVLRKSLMTAGLMGAISCRGGIGKPDAITLKEDDVDIAAPADIGLVVEFKSTHKLPVPMTDVSVVETYNTAYHDVIILRSGRTPAWSRVCHPIGQLLGYMVENGRRYGVLSSATRAYFLFIEGDGEKAQVRISSPWFIGEPNFLRAWAFVHHASCQPCVPLLATHLTWKKTSGDHPTPPAKRKRTGLRSDTNTITEDDGYESVDSDVRSTSGGETHPRAMQPKCLLCRRYRSKMLRLLEHLDMDTMELCFWPIGVDRRLLLSNLMSERMGMNTLTVRLRRT